VRSKVSATLMTASLTAMPTMVKITGGGSSGRGMRWLIAVALAACSS
jgi:hypothetical protein